MRKPRERNIEASCCRWAEKQGWLHRKFKSPGKRSAPDRIFIREGQVLFVEFKAPGKKPTELQKIEHATLREAGMTVLVIDNLEDFEIALLMLCSHASLSILGRAECT